jgi:hypothetical protein
VLWDIEIILAAEDCEIWTAESWEIIHNDIASSITPDCPRENATRQRERWHQNRSRWWESSHLWNLKPFGWLKDNQAIRNRKRFFVYNLCYFKDD